MTYQPVNAFDAFAIRVDSLEPPLVMTQPMGARFADHRGLIEMPALMVLFDDLGGIPFSFADRSSSSLQARLSVSVGPRPGLTDVLRGESVLSMSDEAFGSTTVRVTRGDDEEVAGGRARSARVGRARIGESEIVVGPTLPAPGGAVGGALQGGREA